MPDRRHHRGAHPEDQRLFGAPSLQVLRMAVAEYAWLLGRGYAETAALALVGDHHGLTARQRMAVRRCACSDTALNKRSQRRRDLSACVGRRLGIDGYNLLITVESALSDGMVLIGRDGCWRDLASVHGTYRRVEETGPALRLIAKHLQDAGVSHIDWYLDQPVSNSGRLKALMAEMLEAMGLAWNIELVMSPDKVLAAYTGVVASSDSWVLDRCGEWVNLAAEVIGRGVAGAWCVDLSHDPSPFEPRGE